MIFKKIRNLTLKQKPKPKKHVTVLLDNGHGIECSNGSPKWSDGSKMYEYEFTRNIVRRIAQKLDKEGIAYRIIVPEEHDVPLRERVKRANDFYNKDQNCFYVSIHSNAGGGTGWEVWTSIGKTKSDDIATIFWHEMKTAFPLAKMRLDTLDGDVDKENNYYVLYYTHCPSILTENFFHDNEADCRLIMSEYGRDKIAQAHVDAIKKVIEQLY